MKKIVLISVAMLLFAGGSALAADFPFRTSPVVPFFTWSGCNAGGHFGVARGNTNVTDPVQFVQDQISGAPVTVGVTNASINMNGGFIGGGQFGCDYQPTGANWVVGFEAAFSGSTVKGSTTVALPLGNPGETAIVGGKFDFIPSGTVRFGYAWDRMLFYLKGGIAAASAQYSAIGMFQGTAFNFTGNDLRIGWTMGAGVEWALWENWSARLEYDYYDFGTRNVTLSDNNLVLAGPVSIRQTVQSVSLGLNFHLWAGE